MQFFFNDIQFLIRNVLDCLKIYCLFPFLSVINFSSFFIFLWELNSLNLKKWFLIFMNAYVTFMKFKDTLFFYFFGKTACA